MKITVVEDMTDISVLYRENNFKVRYPYQDSFCISAMNKDPASRLLLIEANERFFLTEFRLDPGSELAVCGIQGDPFVMSNVETEPEVQTNEICSLISDYLGKYLYFPLVYEESHSFKLLNNQKEIISWKRLPSQVIARSSLTKGLSEIAFSRIGSPATKRIKQFKKYPFTIAEINGDAAMDMISSIERLSWKAQAGQDMISRNQMEIYHGLSRSPNSLVRFVMDKNIPVAYRFDYRINDTVFILKWSYNDSYKKYSPGFYLTVEDIPACWLNESIRIIDLHGSLDTLKAAICETDFVSNRFDFGWPLQSAVIKKLSSERLLHDEKINTAFLNNESLKSIYQKQV